MSKDKTEIQPKEYNPILKSIRLQRVYLKSSRSSLRDRLISVNMIKPSIHEKHSFEITSDDQFIVDYTFSLVAKSGNKKVLEAECCFSAEFKSGEKVDGIFLEKFSSISVRFLCFPYAREFFSSLTSRMDLPAFFLPLFKIGPSQ